MTISREGFEDVEIGVDGGIHKESLTANLSSSSGLGAVSGLAVGSLAGALTGGGIATGAAARCRSDRYRRCYPCVRWH